MIKITDSRHDGHEFESSTAEYPPCRGGRCISGSKNRSSKSSLCSSEGVFTCPEDNLPLDYAKESISTKLVVVDLYSTKETCLPDFSWLYSSGDFMRKSLFQGCDDI
ncbi:hypothetical protein TNCV_695001 [Trichonephila clavipes]|nr:hypothetical protein TNCV_695001 [Trichonephila clavipes]